MHNKQSFSQQLPEPYGWPDGMCNDTDGGVWTARWGAGKVIRLTPSGEVDVVIDFPRAWNITSCVFGGEHCRMHNLLTTRTPVGRPLRDICIN